MASGRWIYSACESRVALRRCGWGVRCSLERSRLEAALAIFAERVCPMTEQSLVSGKV